MLLVVRVQRGPATQRCFTEPDLVTAPSLAEVTSAAYLANTPSV